MKIAKIMKYGKAKEVITFEEVEKPKIKEDEILIKINYTTVNRTDTDILKARPFFIRFIFGFFAPKKPIFGREFAGEVEDIGMNVKGFEVGDRVFGYSGDEGGCQSEYLTLNIKNLVAKTPENISDKEASSVLDGMILGHNYVKEVEEESSVLVYGGSGSIGIAVIQLLMALKNIKPIVVTSSRNFELMKKLGVEKVYDYQKSDKWLEEKVDYIIDAVGKKSFMQCKKGLKKKGVYFSTELGFLGANIFYSLLTPIFKGKKVMFPIPKYGKKDMEIFRELLEKNKYKAIIDRVYSFEDIIEAYEFVESGEKVGNVVVKIGGVDESI